MAETRLGSVLARTSFPRDQIRVVLLEGVHAAASELFTREQFDVERLSGSMDEDSLMAAISDAHLLGIRSKTQLTGPCVEAASRLLAVGCFCIGTNQVALDVARSSGIPVYNSPFSNTRSVAELTISEIVALHRRLVDRSMQMHHGSWQKSASGSHEIRGRTLGIIGYGRIGSQVSVLAEAMGMRVIFHDIQPVLALGNATPADSLNDLLQRSDVVTLHVPATEQTNRMMGKSQLAMMRPGAFLINNARGSVVDVDALGEALREGAIGGAAIDVFPEEPQSKKDSFVSPLCGLPNVILTPHVGGSTEEAQEAIAVDVANKLIRFVNNGSTTGAVNVPQVDLPEQGTHLMRDDQGNERNERAHRILNFHENVPGVLSNMHRIISDAGGNISGEYLRTDGEIGYVVVDVDPIETASIVRMLREMPETIRTRLLW